MSVTRRWIGIDPGKEGAIAVLHEDSSVELYTIPVVVLKQKTSAKLTRGKNKGQRKERVKTTTQYDLLGIYELFVRLYEAVPAAVESRVIIEDVHARPGNGIKQAFSFGHGKGLLEMALTAAGFPDYEKVVPGQWRVAMVGRGTDKKASIMKARKMFPKAGITQEAKWEGRSEALLMAAFLRIRDNGGAFSRKIDKSPSKPTRRSQDSLVRPVVPVAPAASPRSAIGPLFGGPLTQPPLTSLAERRAAWKARQGVK